MIKNKYLTIPVKVDIPVTCYDFSELTEKNRMYTTAEVEELLKSQKRLTPLIVKNIIDITERFNRQGVMIFSSTVRHAEEIMSYLPKEDARIVLGDTEISERNKIVDDFKNKKFKYLVNVSVLLLALMLLTLMSLPFCVRLNPIVFISKLLAED